MPPRAAVAHLRQTSRGGGPGAHPGGRHHVVRECRMGRQGIRGRRRGGRGGAATAPGTSGEAGGGMAAAPGHESGGHARNARRSSRRRDPGPRGRAVRVQTESADQRRRSGTHLLAVRSTRQGGDYPRSRHRLQFAVRLRGVHVERGVQRGLSQDEQRVGGRSTNPRGFLPVCGKRVGSVPQAVPEGQSQRDGSKCRRGEGWRQRRPRLVWSWKRAGAGTWSRREIRRPPQCAAGSSSAI